MMMKAAERMEVWGRERRVLEFLKKFLTMAGSSIIRKTASRYRFFGVVF